MKLIALDVGTKRIGVAKADSAVRIAVPYPAVEVDGGELKKIASLARAWDIKSFVIGLPRNSQGEETEQSRYTRQFARELKRTIPEAKICFQDESLTSVEAEKRLKGRKKGYKKGDIDSEAATIILQDFLEEHVGKATTKSAKAAAARYHSVKANKPHRLLTAVLVILILLAGVAGGAYFYYDYNLQPVFTDTDCDEEESTEVMACKPVTFEVENGSSIADVAVNLKNAGLIRDSIVFQVYFRLNYADRTIKAGEYQLTKAMTPSDIIATVVSGDNVFSYTFLPGETIFDFRRDMARLGYTEEEIEAALAEEYTGKYSWIFDGRPEGASLEGYLYGDTYEFYKDASVSDIIERMLEEMADVIKKNNLQALFAEREWSLYQGLTLASIVQKEANNAEDQAKVAQVFLNRLNHGMNLGSDVTVVYAWDLANPDRDPNEVSNTEKLDIDSPYNTRKYGGLTPGPISNPGLSAMLAAATPDAEAVNYLYFLTGDDGLMYYSTTDAEHQQNIIDHCAELCNVAL